MSASEKRLPQIKAGPRPARQQAFRKKQNKKKCTRHKDARGSHSGGTRKHLVSAAFCLAPWGEDPLSASKAPSETRLSLSSSLEHARQLRRIKAGLCLCRKRKAPEFVRDYLAFVSSAGNGSALEHPGSIAAFAPAPDKRHTIEVKQTGLMNWQLNWNCVQQSTERMKVQQLASFWSTV